MKKEYFIIIGLFLIMFISGCTGSLFSTRTSTGSGPNGIQIRFIQPDASITIDEGTSVPVELELTNYAECNVVGTICIKDTLSDVYGGINEQCREFNLAESRIVNKKLDLDKDNFIFPTQPYSNLFTDTPTTLQATAKYSCDIITGSQQKLCTKSVYNRDEPKCNTVETITGNSLGSKVAPVTVSSITKTLLPIGTENTKLKIDIGFKKMSKGKVSSQEQQDFNLKGNPIRVEIDYAGSQMTCTGGSRTDFKDGILYWKAGDAESEKFINCEILLSSGEYRENPINIRLNYVYEITESKSILIKHIKKEEGI